MQSYQEFLCAMCDHRFMQNTSSFGWYPNYRIKINSDEDELYKVKCPKCNEELYAIRGKLQTIARSGLNEDEVVIELVRGV